MPTPLDAFIDGLLTAADPAEQWAVGRVVTVAAGAASDGNALVTVRWNGTNTAAAYADTYSPGVNDVVLMARHGPYLAIVCRLIGTP